MSLVSEAEDSRPSEHQENLLMHHQTDDRSENTAPRASLPSSHSSARRSTSTREKVLPEDRQVAKQAKSRSCIEKADDGLTALAIST
jgi:hypothetical protein